LHEDGRFQFVQVGGVGVGVGVGGGRVDNIGGRRWGGGELDMYLVD